MYSIICKFGSRADCVGDWVYLNRAAVSAKYTMYNRSDLSAGRAQKNLWKSNIEVIF